jgi:hypothetical protein
LEEKLNRTQLKQVIKECLLEIIIEGSPKNVVENVKERNTKQPIQEKSVPHSNRAILEKIFPGGTPPQAKQPKQTNQQIQSRIPEIVSDPIMASIFAETANSGLVESIGTFENKHENPIVDTGVDPLIFEGSQNWANIAFSEKRK